LSPLLKKKINPSCQKLNKLNANRGQIRQVINWERYFLQEEIARCRLYQTKKQNRDAASCARIDFPDPGDHVPLPPWILPGKYIMPRFSLRFISVYLRGSVQRLYNTLFLTILYVWWSMRLINIALRFMSERCIKLAIHRLH